MRSATFIDSSILTNILNVPGKNAHHSVVVTEFLARQAAGTTFVLPVTTIVETGNHVAQLTGAARHSCGQRLVDALHKALVDLPPWVLTGVGWDPELVAAVLEGGHGRPDALTLIDQQLGLGDIGILAEIDAYRARIPSATPIHLWTLDNTLLAAYQS